MAAATGRCPQLHRPTVSVIELPSTQHRADAQRPPGVRLVLRVGAGPPITPGCDRDVAKDIEARRRRVEIAHDVELEAVAGLEVAAENVPFEIRRLPR